MFYIGLDFCVQCGSHAVTWLRKSDEKTINELEWIAAHAAGFPQRERKCLRDINIWTLIQIAKNKMKPTEESPKVSHGGKICSQSQEAEAGGFRVQGQVSKQTNNPPDIS